MLRLTILAREGGDPGGGEWRRVTTLRAAEWKRVTDLRAASEEGDDPEGPRMEEGDGYVGE